MAGVSLEHVSKTFQGVTAVNDVSLECPDGDFVVLVGSSGSGKTTLLRLIAGLETASSGEIRIGDRRVNDVHPSDRDVAMVFQSFALYPHMTVRQNMSVGLRNAGVSREEVRRRVAEVSADLQISGLLDRRPRQLSGGQQQRVALGRSMVREPSVFLMDEPLSNLDSRLRIETRTELIRLQRRLGTTFVYVTHDQTEAMTMGSMIAVMRDGEVQQYGKPFEVFDKPANRYVAAFMGETEINILEGVVAPHDGAYVLRSSVGDIAVPDEYVRLRLAEMASERVELGVRPEHFYLTDANNAILSGQVELFERLGSRSLILVDVGRKTLTVETSEVRELAVGAPVHLRMDWERAHFFDAETGRSIAAFEK